MPIHPSLSIAKVRNQQALMDMANVLAVGLGLKRTNGELTNIPAVKVFVSKKLPTASLAASDIVPAELPAAGGPIATDVEQMAPLTVPVTSALESTGKEAVMLRSYQRPVYGGLSASHFQFQVGTIAIPVRDRQGAGPYLLSNNHVFARLNQAKIGDAVIQPALMDGGSVKNSTIGFLDRFIPVVFGGSASNNVDAALAQVRPEAAILSRVALAGAPVAIRPAHDLQAGETVHKVGRTTGLTFGHVVATGCRCTINYSITGLGNLTALYDNQILTTAMAGFGDSGSLLFDAARRAVGMLGGGSDTHTVFNACDLLEDLLDIQFVLNQVIRPPLSRNDSGRASRRHLPHAIAK